MKKKIIFAAALLALLLTSFAAGGCAGGTDETETQEASETESNAELPDGVYTAEFHTDSSMFHVSEACGGKGTLTVENGKMTIHVSLVSQSIVNLYPGLAEDAQKDGAVLLEPTEDTVSYSDGTTETVNGFDVPVPALDTEFDLAIVGTKGKWYDHKVSVSDPVPAADGAEGVSGADQSTDASSGGGQSADTQGGADQSADAQSGAPENGTYQAELVFEGGSGKAKILSPARLTAADGRMTAVVEWNSPNYDYMIVDSEKYLPVNTDGNSTFEIPVAALDVPISIIGDTIAMSTPHEIEYTITFRSDTLRAAD